MERLSFKINEVEGPLDLILQLISKHKLNIYDIEIFELVTQYTAYIEQMREQNLEVSSDFLEMAARLVYIKTVELLPKHEKTEDPKQELTGQLIEYRACKQAALLLERQNCMGYHFSRPPVQLDERTAYPLVHHVSVLVGSYLAVMGDGKRRLPPPADVFSPIVRTQVVSVGSRIVYILKRLYKSSKLTLSALFSHPAQRSEMVATFLALLELIKDKRVVLKEDESIVLGIDGGGEIE